MLRELSDEPILSRLIWLFQNESPDLTVFGEQLRDLNQRIQQVQQVNDFFFSILDNDTAVEEVENLIREMSGRDLPPLERVKLPNVLFATRETSYSPSEKITNFVQSLNAHMGFNLAEEEPVKKCLEALRGREKIGTTNALLVKANGEGALVVPLQVKVQSGSGQVHNVIHDREDFKKTVERARHAMCDHNFIAASDDVLCTLDLTEPQYRGTSIGLAAAVSMYGAARKVVIDPYSAFTGDINWDGQHWQVRGVSNIPAKLGAFIWLSPSFYSSRERRRC